MEISKIPYEKQIFVCTNVGGKVCGDNDDGEVIFKKLREIAKEKGLHPKVRIAQAKCLGQCGKGCNIMSYPDNVWYSGVTFNDVDTLAQKFFE